MMLGSGVFLVIGLTRPGEVNMRSTNGVRAVSCRHDGPRVVRVLAAALLLVVVGMSAAGSASTTAKAPTEFFVSDTGHALAEPFLSAWATRDGMSTLGLPVSEPTIQSGRVAQYFQ